jgi:hypothetical protein
MANAGDSAPGLRIIDTTFGQGRDVEDDTMG